MADDVGIEVSFYFIVVIVILSAGSQYRENCYYGFILE